MKRWTKHLGVALVAAGATLLIVSYAVGWTQHNSVLLTGLLLTVTGLVTHVKVMKRQDKY